MVKLTGPMHSTTALGTVAKTLIFSQSKNTNYMKTHAAPKNPKTDLQVSVRALVKFLSENWKTLSLAQQQSWFLKATSKNIHLYHAYIGANQSRWTTFRAPSKQDPATETLPAPANPLITAFPSGSTAVLRIWSPTGAMPWGLFIHRGTITNFPRLRENVIGILLQDIAADVYYYDKNLTPGTYYYRAIPFTETGLKGPNSAQRTVVIT